MTTTHLDISSFHHKAAEAFEKLTFIESFYVPDILVPLTRLPHFTQVVHIATRLFVKLQTCHKLSGRVVYMAQEALRSRDFAEDNYNILHVRLQRYMRILIRMFQRFVQAPLSLQQEKAGEILPEVRSTLWNLQRAETMIMQTRLVLVKDYGHPSWTTTYAV